MTIATHIVRGLFSPRRKNIDRFRREPAAVQREQLEWILTRGRKTLFGADHGLCSVTDYEGFRRAVPVREYEESCGYVERARRGECDVLWPGRVRFFAKSSGTTDARSKYIPVTGQGLWRSHMRGPRDLIAIFSDICPESRVFEGKTLTLGGSRRVEREGECALTGDLSAILIENTPAWADLRRAPSRETALIEDFDLKVRRICEECAGENIRSFAGVPSWNMVLLRKILEYTGKSNLLEVWPDLELFIHGGMSFAPYRELYRRLIPSDSMKYMETYNASEGFFAIGDDLERDDMLLMLDYGTFYEFEPADGGEPVPLEGVRTGVNYAMIITSCNGLWRYRLGDTVEFTSTSPCRIRITGRTKLFINVFGEELMVDNAERAMHAACAATGAEVEEYTAAPIFMDSDRKGSHQWVVEFRREPADRTAFIRELDGALRSLNSDYDAKRTHDATLLAPTLSVVPRGTFMAWMSRRGKVGGQNKVPRLSNSREYVEELTNIKP